MRSTLLTIVLLVFAGMAWGQETFKKRYSIKEKLKFGTGYVFLTKETNDTVKFIDFSKKEKANIEEVYKKDSLVEVTREESIGGKKVVITRTTKVDSSFYKEFTQIRKKEERVNLDGKQIKSFVKFDEDKIYVNPYLSNEKNRKEIYYYQLQNRQTAKLCFDEVTVSALTIPVKYRFKKDDIPEEFSTSFNMNAFVGYSFGRDRFFHQKKVGNKTISEKITFGAIGGISTIKLTAGNTSISKEPIEAGKEFTKGLASVGLGTAYAYNKLNIGAFVGWDYAVGESASTWNHHAQPWIGLAIGYGLFNF